MNNRIRQICKVQLEIIRKEDHVLCTLKLEGSKFQKIIFIPKDKLEEAKAEYGDDLYVWDLPDTKGGKV